MSKVISLGVIVAMTALLWRAIDGMNREALAMAIGVLFGILAGIPMALVVLASSRRARPDADLRIDTQGEEIPKVPLEGGGVDDWEWVGPVARLEGHRRWARAAAPERRVWVINGEAAERKGARR